MSEESASETKQRMANKIATPKNKMLFGKVLSAIPIDKTKSDNDMKKLMYGSHEIVENRLF